MSMASNYPIGKIRWHSVGLSQTKPSSCSSGTGLRATSHRLHIHLPLYSHSPAPHVCAPDALQIGDYARIIYTRLNFARLNFARLQFERLKFKRLKFARLDFERLNYARTITLSSSSSKQRNVTLSKWCDLGQQTVNYKICLCCIFYTKWHLVRISCQRALFALCNLQRRIDKYYCTSKKQKWTYIF